MTDVERALLGDRAAQERLTAAGVLLECPFCGGPAHKDFSYKAGSVGCDKCRKFVVEEKETVCKSWNTRASLLTPEQLEALERMEGSGIGEHSTNQV